MVGSLVIVLLNWRIELLTKKKNSTYNYEFYGYNIPYNILILPINIKLQMLSFAQLFLIEMQ